MRNPQTRAERYARIAEGEARNTRLNRAAPYVIGTALCGITFLPLLGAFASGVR